MNIIEKLTEKHRNKRITLKNRKNVENSIKYTLSWKARLVLYLGVGIAMVAAPFAYVYTMTTIAFIGLWQSFIVMPLETKRNIMANYIAKGIAKPQIDVTEEA